jgi:hypothetical protein
MSTWTYRQSDGKAASKIVPPRLRIPCWKGLSADSEEKREPASDIDTVEAESLNALTSDGRLEKQTARIDLTQGVGALLAEDCQRKGRQLGGEEQKTKGWWFVQSRQLPRGASS